MGFKKGDRVCIQWIHANELPLDMIRGKEKGTRFYATVITSNYEDDEDDGEYGIEFPEPFVGGHDCDGYAKPGHGWFIYAGCLESVDCGNYGEKDDV